MPHSLTVSFPGVFNSVFLFNFLFSLLVWSNPSPVSMLEDCSIISGHFLEACSGYKVELAVRSGRTGQDAAIPALNGGVQFPAVGKDSESQKSSWRRGVRSRGLESHPKMPVGIEDWKKRLTPPAGVC